MSILKSATEESDGTFSVRTEGLHNQRHAELEIVGIPQPAVEAAAKLIDYLVEELIEGGAVLKANENVGLPLSIEGHDDIAPVFVGLRVVATQPAASGFFAKLRGGNKGVLRLADLFDRKSEVPLTAVATMMLYRANCRAVMGDVAGAVSELEASLTMLPGASGPEGIPALNTDGAKVNWQNHLSYLRLAELTEDEKKRAALLGTVYSRFTWLALDELGATAAELLPLTVDELRREAERIVAVNLANTDTLPGPQESLRFVLSPIWTPGTDGTSVRSLSMIPAAFTDHYYGEHLRKSDLVHAVVELTAESVFQFRTQPWKLAQLTAGTRTLYESADAPRKNTEVPRHAGHTTLSALIAEAARYLRAGATVEEIRAGFGLTVDDALGHSLQQKVQKLELWEMEEYMRALTPSGP